MTSRTSPQGVEDHCGGPSEEHEPDRRDSLPGRGFEKLPVADTLLPLAPAILRSASSRPPILSVL